MGYFNFGCNYIMICEVWFNAKITLNEIDGFWLVAADVIRLNYFLLQFHFR
jgi:hypothetical protein